ncbi:MAG: hypothetical protein ACK4Q5_18790 [Saprospiraceae bacterium]
MQLLLEVKNPTEFQLLLQYVRQLSSAKILGQQPGTTASGSPKGTKSFFDRHYGSLKSGMTIEEIDQQLFKLRQEWERDTW